VAVYAYSEREEEDDAPEERQQLTKGDLEHDAGYHS
jgi:hypothetical protein